MKINREIKTEIKQKSLNTKNICLMIYFWFIHHDLLFERVPGIDELNENHFSGSPKCVVFRPSRLQYSITFSQQLYWWFVFILHCACTYDSLLTLACWWVLVFSNCFKLLSVFISSCFFTLKTRSQPSVFLPLTKDSSQGCSVNI